MKKLATLFSLLCILNVFLVAGLLLFLTATGRLDQTKFQAIADLLRHKGTPDNLRPQVLDILEPPTTAPSSMPATQPAFAALASPSAGTAEDRIDYASQAMEQDRLLLENEKRKLRDMKTLLDTTQAEVNDKLKKIEDKQKTFAQSVTQTTTKSAEESFQKSLTLYNQLKPKQIKDLFLPMPPELVAKYLQAMETDQAGKIISEYQTPEDRKIIARVIELIRASGTESASGNRAAAAAAPGT